MKKIFGDDFWLSYWPGVFMIIVNALAVTMTLKLPYPSEWLHNCTLVVNACGMAGALKTIYGTWQYKRGRAERMERLSADAKKVLEKVRPELDALMAEVLGEEWQNASQEDFARFQRKAMEIIDREFLKLDKNRSSESKPDKP